jgi:hypothetical protein
MSTPTRGGLHQERRAALRQPTPPNAILTWVQNPAVVFLLPLVILLSGPTLYNLFSPNTILPVTESHLQEVSSLLDEIYTTLVNMTFIPATAIKRGPHHINTTAISCRRDPAALRLMEIMPYVDRVEVEEEDEVQRTDWLYGGEFDDYRREDLLHEGCDPIKAQNTFWSITPTIVALTSWGTGGWNGDQTQVLLYDIEYNAIKVWHGEDWIRFREGENVKRFPQYYEGSITSLFKDGVQIPSAGKLEDDFDLISWFDAPWLLRRILDAYQTLASTPWETSNREEGWGVNVTILPDLLRKNGWPETFDGDQFNADFIRARHAPSGKGYAEAVYERIENLEGSTTNDPLGIGGDINMDKHNIKSYEMQARNAEDEQDRWFHVFRAQSHRWRLQRHENDLIAAKEEAERLCPDGVCVADEDLILWEFHSLEKEYQKRQRMSPPESTCESDLYGLIEWAPPSDRFGNCVIKRRREAHWLHLAYTQSRADALEHCARTGRDLLPQPSLEERARAKIDQLNESIKRDQAHAVIMYDWAPTLPEHAEKARTYLEMEASAAANGPWNMRDTIDWIEEILAQGDQKDQLKLQRCLDDYRCF